MGRNYLKGDDGDRADAVLAAAGDNFSLLLRRLAWLLRGLFVSLWRAVLVHRLAEIGTRQRSSRPTKLSAAAANNPRVIHLRGQALGQ